MITLSAGRILNNRQEGRITARCVYSNLHSCICLHISVYAVSDPCQRLLTWICWYMFIWQYEFISISGNSSIMQMHLFYLYLCKMTCFVTFINVYVYDYHALIWKQSFYLHIISLAFLYANTWSKSLPLPFQPIL